MPGDTFQISASGNSFVNLGHTYQSGELSRLIILPRAAANFAGGNKYARLLNFLLPTWQSSKSLALYWDHDQARQRHVGRTGEWFRGSDDFKSWLRQPNSFIWLHGISGSGKTVLRYER